ncbi:MAG: restriction endonuclease subunit R, partial [Bacteroidales bacterium]
VAYRKLGVNINPLLLIQLPNDNKIALTAGDKQIIDEVTQYLDVMKGINEENERLAVWLSDNKSPHLDEITRQDSVTEVLLFKQAIALGWDCPRAAVLLIFRDLQSTTFTIQTVGRILRMPEQKYYPDTLLNQGYVYTNLSRNQIEVVQDDMNYISTSPARRINSYHEGHLHLLSTYYNTRRPDRNRLGSRYRIELYKTVENKWGLIKTSLPENYVSTNHELLKSKMIDAHISELDVYIPEDATWNGGAGPITAKQNAVFIRTPEEIEKMFLKFCRDHIGDYAPFDSVPVLAGALIRLFEEYLEIFETQAQMIILHPHNRVQFIELIEESYRAYEAEMEKVAQNAVRNPHVFSWEVPAERIYNLNNYTLKLMPTHALVPFHEQTSASAPEKLFALFLERNKDCIEWWYKNGDSGKEHLAIPYVNSKGISSLFYVDFIILMKDGTRCLFDTKTKGSDPEAHLKHNALCVYIGNLRKKNIKVKGGILINDHNDPDCWRFSESPIQNTDNLNGWSYFNPVVFVKIVAVE